MYFISELLFEFVVSDVIWIGLIVFVLLVVVMFYLSWCGVKVKLVEVFCYE